LYVFRPGDANEVIHSYKAAMKLSNHPSAMVLSRQNVPTMDRTVVGSAEGAEKGGYVLIDCQGTPQVILMASGSELPIVVQAQQKLSAEGIRVRVVSMPCFELFEDQTPAYRESVLPKAVTARVACEAGLRLGWDRYIGLEGHFVGMSGFGASAPIQHLYEHFKITADQVASHAKVSIA
jgi:transketolase